MPFDTPPGQVLSSVPSSSDKRRTSKLGGCAGVLFQIFHGKRLFPRKSLPAERPKQAASNHTDDKLPIAKLLLIADENRGGPLQDENEEVEAENVSMVESYEEKAPGRTPGVVARLMGLETMPSPESVWGERKQSELRTNMDYELSTDAPQSDTRTSTVAAAQHYPSLPRAKMKEFNTDLPARFAARQKKYVHDGTTKSKFLAKGPSLSPHHIDASIPSSAKGDLLNRNSICTQKAAHLLQVSPKMLKANPQPNRQTGSPRLQGSFSGAKSGALNPKVLLAKPAAQAPCNKRDDIKAAHVTPRYTNHDMISRRQIADLQKSHLSQQHLRNNNKFLSHEATLVKRKNGNERVLEQPKVAIEKSRSDWRRQDETSRRLSQPSGHTTVKSQRARPSRHPSPPKSFQDSSGGACSSQASNMPSSSEGALTSQLMKSHVGSNDVSAGKHSSSSVRGTSSKLEDIDEFVDTMQPTEFVCDKVADLLRGKETRLKISDTSHSGEPEDSMCSQFSQDGSTSSAIYTESLQRSSLESSISSDPSLSEYTTSSEECSKFVVEENVAGREREEEKWKDDSKKLPGSKKASDLFLTDCSSPSLSESVTVISAGDEVSSHTESDGIAKSVDSVRTYSGRNTAAILQELLTALSTSTTQKKSSFAKNAESTVSCSLDSEVGKPQFLPGGFVHSSEDPSMESTFQDSASSTSSESSQLSQGTEDNAMDNVITSKDCASIAEMQAVNRYLPETSGTGRTQLQHELSRDCEALMSTISKLHHIDPEVIGLKVRPAKDPSVEVKLNAVSGDGLSGYLLDSCYPDKHEELTQQLDFDLFSSTTLTADEDADSIYRSDIESSFRSGCDEVAVLNKKLVTDCINEAFKSLSKQIYKFSSSLSEPPSATHVLSRVYKQLDDWRGMATSMNLDHMVEKEMNATTRNWRNIGTETEEVAEVVESTIFSGLLEEVLLELI